MPAGWGWQGKVRRRLTSQPGRRLTVPDTVAAGQVQMFWLAERVPRVGDGCGDTGFPTVLVVP